MQLWMNFKCSVYSVFYAQLVLWNIKVCKKQKEWAIVKGYCDSINIELWTLNSTKCTDVFVWKLYFFSFVNHANSCFIQINNLFVTLTTLFYSFTPIFLIRTYFLSFFVLRMFMLIWISWITIEEYIRMYIR